ncbi:MAG: hypothetical protein WAX66_03395 [Patescibacteria group bacterium]
MDKQDKQKAELRVSLIPLVILVGLILGAGYFLLQGEITLPKFSKGPTIRRLGGFPAVVDTEKVLEKQRWVIKSEEELSQFLNLVDSTGLLELKDKVNFEKEFILAVSSGTNEETGHKIKIRKVYGDSKSKKIIVQVEETEQGDSCSKELSKNIAVDMVSLSKTDWQIKFDKVIKNEECSN